MYNYKASNNNYCCYCYFIPYDAFLGGNSSMNEWRQ